MLAVSEEVRTQVRLRPFVTDDARCVVSDWVRSYASNRVGPPLLGPVYKAGQTALVERLLKRCDVLVATHADTPDLILGWCVAERHSDALLVHFAYVKSAFRRLGVASLLLAGFGWGRGQPLHYTHHVAFTKTHGRRMGAVFNPYLGGIL